MRILIISEDPLSTATREYYGPTNVASNFELILKVLNIDFTIIKNPIRIASDSSAYISYFVLDSYNIVLNCAKYFLIACKYDAIVFQYMRGLSAIIYSLTFWLSDTPILKIIYFKPPWWHVYFLNKYFKNLIVFNPKMVEYLISIGVPQDKIKVISPPIDVNVFRKMDKKILRNKYNLESNKYILLYHGRPSVARGLILFLETTEALRDRGEDFVALLSLADVSDDISPKYVRDYINEHRLGSNIRILTGKNNAAEIYNIADVVIFPFLKNSAICPALSILEAMACECIIIASDVDSSCITHVLKNEYNGFLINPTTNDLIICLNNIKKKSHETINDVGINARLTIQEHCSFKKTKELLYSILEDLC